MPWTHHFDWRRFTVTALILLAVLIAGLLASGLASLPQLDLTPAGLGHPAAWMWLTALPDAWMW